MRCGCERGRLADSRRPRLSVRLLLSEIALFRRIEFTEIVRGFEASEIVIVVRVEEARTVGPVENHRTSGALGAEVAGLGFEEVLDEVGGRGRLRRQRLIESERIGRRQVQQSGRARTFIIVLHRDSSQKKTFTNIDNNKKKEPKMRLGTAES